MAFVLTVNSVPFDSRVTIALLVALLICIDTSKKATVMFAHQIGGHKNTTSITYSSMLTAQAAAFTVSPLVAGVALGASSSKAVLYTSLMGYGLTLILFSVLGAPALWAVLPLGGLCEGVFFWSKQKYISLSLPAEHRSVVAFALKMAARVASFLGVPLLGHVLNASPHVAFLIPGVLVIGATITLLVMFPAHGRRQPYEDIGVDGYFRSQSSWYSALLMRRVLTQFATVFTLQSFLYTMSFWFIDHFHMTDGSYATSTTLAGLALCLADVFCAYLTSVTSNNTLLYAGSWVTLLGAALWGPATYSVHAALFVAFTLHFGCEAVATALNSMPLCKLTKGDRHHLFVCEGLARVAALPLSRLMALGGVKYLSVTTGVLCSAIVLCNYARPSDPDDEGRSLLGDVPLM